MKTLLAGLFGLVVTVSVAAAADTKPIEVTKSGSTTNAKVGDTVYFGVANSSLPGKIVSKVKVTVNGKKIASPDTKLTGAVGGGFYNYVHKANKKGRYTVKVTPVYDNGKTGTTSTFTLVVK